MAQTPKPAQLKTLTVAAFNEYVREAEAGVEEALHRSGPFLWSEVSSERAQLVRGVQVVAHFWAGQGPVKVPNGLIHDWIGAVFISATSLKETLDWSRTTITTKLSTSPR